MNRFLGITLVQFSLLTIAFSQDTTRLFSLPETTLNKLLEYEDETVRVKGFVESTNKNATNIQFLNFRGSDFLCVTFARHLRNFETQPVDLYKEKWIEVTGKIYKYRGKPQIHLTDPEQVKIIDQPAPDIQKTLTESPHTGTEQAKKEQQTPSVDKPTLKHQSKPNKPILEVIDGVPAIDWRKYFPSVK